MGKTKVERKRENKKDQGMK